MDLCNNHVVPIVGKNYSSDESGVVVRADTMENNDNFHEDMSHQLLHNIYQWGSQ